jgi:deoxyribose-phosphate aldolase
MENLKINRYLDAAVLKPEFTESDALEALKLSLRYDVKSVCVRPCDIELALQVCRGSETRVGCVLNFPHGLAPSAVKAYEAEQYIQSGVAEIDMVVNYSRIKSAKWQVVEDDIAAVHQITKPAGVLLKVILETAMLSLDEIAQATRIVAGVGADYVKTSTGFYGEGATVEAVECMLQAAEDKIKVKASGGIRDYERAKMFVELGCGRLGVNYASVPAICDQSTASSGQASGY